MLKLHTLLYVWKLSRILGDCSHCHVSKTILRLYMPDYKACKDEHHTRSEADRALSPVPHITCSCLRHTSIPKIERCRNSRPEKEKSKGQLIWTEALQVGSQSSDLQYNTNAESCQVLSVK